MYSVNIALFIYSTLMLVAIYLYSMKTKYNLMSDKFFKSLIRITFILLFFDLLARVEGDQYPVLFIFKHVGNFTTYAISHFIPSLWLLYIHYKIYSDTERTKKLYKYFIGFSVINWILLIITQFTGWYYDIDAANVYTRGPLFMYTQIINGLLMVMAIFILIKKYDRIERSDLIAYLIFTLIPATGLVVQIILPGIAYIPNSVTGALVILFIFVQNNRMRNDHLTDVFNRRQIDLYLEDKIMQARRGHAFTTILLDVDDFKVINDTYGHALGDEAIKQTARLLYSVCEKTEFLGRFGGDEFLIITTKYEDADIQRFLSKVDETFESFNKQNAKYHLNISYGYFTYTQQLSLTRKEFMDIVDRNMFSNKRNKKKLGS